jgi:hypothetical protein
VPGSRSYECEVIGVAGTVKLSSKSLAQLHSPRSHIQAPDNSETSLNSNGSAEGSESDAPDVEDCYTRRTGYAELTAHDWEKVHSFRDECIQSFPNFDIDCKGRMRTAVAKTPVDLFLAFLPPELVEPNFQRWREHAQQQELKGLGILDLSLLYRFCAILLKMGLGGLRRRELYFDEALYQQQCRSKPSRTSSTPSEAQGSTPTLEPCASLSPGTTSALACACRAMGGMATS